MCRMIIYSVPSRLAGAPSPLSLLISTTRYGERPTTVSGWLPERPDATERLPPKG